VDTDKPDDTRTHETDFAALWSSDGVTRSLAATGSGLPADLPFLFSAGQQFGPYQIVRPLGKGGMGQVYEAEEIDSGRRVAVKLLSRGLGDGEERERFLREGQLAAALSHPNCVYVFGTSEVQGFPIITMELAPAGTLKDLVDPAAPMAVATAVDAILQVIAGLEAAAAIGILHRDVKPSNCFVDRDGRVMVGDFGLSISASGGAAAAGRGVMGTPGFASPEQLAGAALDVRSDIYSVGATLYYLFTGKSPFDEGDLQTMMTRVASETAPAVTVARPDVPGRVGSIVAKCLATQPAHRYPNYAALAAALEPFRTVPIVPARLGRRFLAGFIDSYAAALPLMPLNVVLGQRLILAERQGEIILLLLPSIV
jgi:serine/threonine protein kinase